MIVVFVLIAVFMGAIGVVQVGINSDLRTLLGNPYQAALISTTVSTTFLIVLSLVLYGRPYPEIEVLRQTHWWTWTGGVIGALFVASTAGLVSRLGSSVLFTLVILGQLSMAVVMDHYGWFGLDKQPTSLTRMAGIGLVLVGVVVVRKS